MNLSSATEYYSRSCRAGGRVSVVLIPTVRGDKFFVMYEGKDVSEHFALKAAKRSADYVSARY